MDTKKHIIKGGLYLVINPSMPLEELLVKTEAALQGGVAVLQIWDHWKEGADQLKIIGHISILAHRYQVPVLINENRELLQMDGIDGIHFDEIPDDLAQLKSGIQKTCIIGLTCGNDFKKIEWAAENQLDYISFCSIFPSGSVDTCEIIDREVIRKARHFTQMPIFLSGGITLDNLSELGDTGMDGIAVISGIMGTGNAKEAAQEYSNALHKLHIP